MAGFLTLLPQATATAVDLWDSEIKSELSGIDFTVVEAKFDENTARFAGRVEKVKGDSRKVLRRFLQEGRKYDLIYVDGSHKAFDVYHDAILAWQLLNTGGMLIFDDYLWMANSPNVFDVPYHAIQSFLEAYAGEYSVLQMDYRVFLKKLR
jgi:predicted O-methyltransferase YrrM